MAGRPQARSKVRVTLLLAGYMLGGILSCSGVEVTEVLPLPPRRKAEVNDTDYVKFGNYRKGDVRRYGVFPDSTTRAGIVDSLLDLGSKGQPLNFPQGTYRLNLVFRGRTDIDIAFDSCVIEGRMDIDHNDGLRSERLRFRGDLTLMDRLFIRQSSDLYFDTLRVRSPMLKKAPRNRGVNIYAGSERISFGLLRVSDTGGHGEKREEFTAAAIQLHGWNDNPAYVRVGHLQVVNSPRTGAYITGKGHRFGRISIDGFGLGTPDNMRPLDDAPAGSERNFAGLWLNKCDDCWFGAVVIRTAPAPGLRSLKLNLGRPDQPTIIEKLVLAGGATQMTVEDDPKTNILVKAYEEWD